MHRFLTAFLVLSTLAMTQNVVAGTPTAMTRGETSSIPTAALAATREAVPARMPATVGGEVPAPSTMLLLVTGLAGLSAVGGRGRAGATAVGLRAGHSRERAERGILA